MVVLFEEFVGELSTAPGLRIYLLGKFRAEVGGHPIEETAWTRPSAKTLLKVLAVAPGRQMHRDQLRELLWPHMAPMAADSSLRKALYHARHALQPNLPAKAGSAYLVTSAEMISLSASVWVDADHFERLAQDALRGEDVASYENALMAYGGKMLPEDLYEEWSLGRRDRLAQIYFDLNVRLAGILEGRGAFAAAAERLRQVLAEQPAREDLHRAIMRLHVAGGCHGEALQQYETCRTKVRQELDADVEGETVDLYQAIRADSTSGLRSQPPAETGAPSDQAPLPSTGSRSQGNRLVGRERAVAGLLDNLNQAIAGTGATVFLSGEAGVGKSRLAEEVAREAHLRGALVLWGADYEHEGLFPYGPFVEALSGYLSSRPESERRNLAKANVTLARLLPILNSAVAQRDVDPLPAAPRDLDIDRLLLFNAVLRLLSELATGRPVLLVLDDLHTADEGTLALLHHLTRAAPQHRWLLLGTYRTEDVATGAALERMCSDLERRRLAHRLSLPRLERADCDRLVAGLLPDAEVNAELYAHLYRLSLGNPLFVQVLLNAMRSSGNLLLEDGRWRLIAGFDDPVPQQVRDLIESRLQGLEPGVVDLLSVAAVAGAESRFSELQSAFLTNETQTESMFLDHIDGALATRMLEERRDGFVFRHPLFRSALYERLSHSRRAHLHAILGAVIERTRPEAVEVLADHFSKSHSDEKALVYLERAGDRAAGIYANSIAEAHYRNALERLDNLGRPIEAARLREKLGTVLTRDRNEALRLLEQALDVFQREGDQDAVIRVTANIVRAHWHRGTPEDGLAQATSIRPQVDVAPPSSGLALLHVSLAHICFSLGRTEDALQEAGRASDIARTIGDSHMLADAEVRRGTSLSILGHVREAVPILEEATVLAGQSRDPILYQLALNNVGDTLLMMGRLSDALGYLEIGDRLRAETGIHFILGTLVEGLIYLGRWDEAATRIDRDFAGLPHAGFAEWHALMHGHIYLRSGHWQDASRNLDMALKMSEASKLETHSDPNDETRERIQVLFAELEIRQDRPDLAIQRLQPISHREDRHVVAILANLAWAHLELDEVQTATRYITHAHRLVNDGGTRLFLPDVLRTRGLILARQERRVEAHRSLREAAEVAHGMNYPYAEARALFELGKLDPPTGEDPAQALAYLTSSLEIFRILGADKDVESTTRVIAQRGAVAPMPAHP